MKKFFTVVPLQPEGKLDSYLYEAVDNQKLQLDKKISFPILCAIDGYAVSDEAFQLIAITIQDENAKRNVKILQKEFDELCEDRGYKGEFLCVSIPADDAVSTHIETFQKLIDLVADEDELFSCMTYGTKPLSEVLRMAIHYAYRLHKNTSIGCMIYGQISRPSVDTSTWTGKIYDQTALVHLNEMVGMLAERGIEQPKEFLHSIISM